MFKRQPKHVFTCPDVIYLQQKAKRTKKIAWTINLALLAGMLTAVMLIPVEDELETLPDTPEEAELLS